MQGNDSSATAGPLLLFFEQKLSATDIFKTKGVVDQTRPVPLPVTPVESLDDGARKTRALVAGAYTAARGAVLDLAFPAMLRFRSIRSPAAGTRLLLSEMHIANSTCDSARSEHLLGYSLRHFHGRLSPGPRAPWRPSPENGLRAPSGKANLRHGTESLALAPGGSACPRTDR